MRTRGSPRARKASSRPATRSRSSRGSTSRASSASGSRTWSSLPKRAAMCWARSRRSWRSSTEWRPAPLPSADVISTNQFRNGTHIDVEGTVFKIVEFQHVKPGKGGAFVRTKLRRASDGAVIDRTFRAGEKFRPVRTETRRMQFLYRDGADAHLMDSESYEQLTLPESSLSEALRWIKESDEVDLLYIDEKPADVQLPSAIDLKIAETDPGL